MRKSIKHRGVSVIEIVVAAAILVSLATAVTGAWQIYFKASGINGQNTQAALLAEEAAEALNYMRDLSWSQKISPLTTGMTYYLYWNSNSLTYSTSTTAVAISGAYTVSFVLSQVNRDINDNIVTSGGTVDTHTKSVDISVKKYPSQEPLTGLSIILHDTYAN